MCTVTQDRQHFISQALIWSFTEVSASSLSQGQDGIQQASLSETRRHHCNLTVANYNRPANPSSDPPTSNFRTPQLPHCLIDNWCAHTDLEVGDCLTCTSHPLSPPFILHLPPCPREDTAFSEARLLSSCLERSKPGILIDETDILTQTQSCKWDTDFRLTPRGPER